MLLKRHAQATVYTNALANLVYCSNFQHSQEKSSPPLKTKQKKSQIFLKATILTCLPDCKQYVDMSHRLL